MSEFYNLHINRMVMTGSAKCDLIKRFKDVFQGFSMPEVEKMVLGLDLKIIGAVDNDWCIPIKDTKDERLIVQSYVRSRCCVGSMILNQRSGGLNV